MLKRERDEPPNSSWLTLTPGLLCNAWKRYLPTPSVSWSSSWVLRYQLGCTRLGTSCPQSCSGCGFSSTSLDLDPGCGLVRKARRSTGSEPSRSVGTFDDRGVFAPGRRRGGRSDSRCRNDRG